MSKKKANQQKRALPLSRAGRSAVFITVLVLSLGMVVGILARWNSLRPANKINAMLAPAGFSPNSPSREYVYVGGRLMATEDTASLTQANLALNKPATQSSTFTQHGSTFTASRAVDGNTDGEFWGAAKSTSATNYESRPWWQVDLGGTHSIQSIQLWRRTDCCPEMLSDFYVFVSDVPFTSTDLSSTQNQAGVSSYYTPGDGETPTTISVNRSGRYVRVQLSGSQHLILAEAQVWGTAGPQVTLPTENVVWTHVVGMMASGNNLVKSAPLSIWDSGAVSTKAIASGDGYVEFTTGETTSHKMIGLSYGDDSTSYGDIDFALYPQANGYVYVYEGGAQIGNFGTYVPGDRLRIAVEGGRVKYQQWRGGAWQLLKMSDSLPRYPLLVDTSFYTPNSTINNVILAGTLQDQFLVPQTENVVWTNAYGVTASGNTLTRAGSTSGWDAGAVSTRAIASGSGYMEFTIGETGTFKMCGLSKGDTDQHNSDIDFAIYAHANGYLQIYEKGVWVKNPERAYQLGDRLKVSVENGVVKYWQNDQLLWTSPAPANYPLLVDTSLYSPGAMVKSVVISGLLQ